MSEGGREEEPFVLMRYRFTLNTAFVNQVIYSVICF